MPICWQWKVAWFFLEIASSSQYILQWNITSKNNRGRRRTNHIAWIFFLAKFLARKASDWLKCNLDLGIFSVCSAHRLCTISDLFWSTLESWAFKMQRYKSYDIWQYSMTCVKLRIWHYYCSFFPQFLSHHNSLLWSFYRFNCLADD